MRILLQGVFSLLLLASCANDLVEEQVDVDNGAVEVCGEGEGLNPCMDANGESLSEEEDPDFIKLDSTTQLEKSSTQVRDESPAELEKTIESMEQ